MLDCRDVQKRLTDYTEGTISSDEKNLIDTHIASCEQCKVAARDLKRTVELIQNLDEIESPPWLKQKIMLQVREDAAKKSWILQKLFYPLHIKVPIEAFATLFVFVLALFIYRTTGPEMKAIQLPAVSKRASPMEKPLKESQRLREKPKPLPATPTTPIEKRVVTRGAEAVTDTLDRKAGAQVRPPVQAQEKIQAPSAGAVARDAQESEAEAQKPTFKMATREKARHISVTLTVRDAAQAARETENLLNQLGAQKIKRELIENTQIITAELQAQKVEELSEKLRTIGAIKERDSFQQIPEGDVPVRIEITRAP